MKVLRPLQQLLNHIPNEYHLCNKAYLANNAREFMEKNKALIARVGTFVPETFDLSNTVQFSTFKKQIAKPSQLWIIKPSRLSRERHSTSIVPRNLVLGGRGIFVAHDEESFYSGLHLPKTATEAGEFVAQRYVSDLLLFNGRKFDVRAFLFIASAKPWIVLYHQGYIRVNIEEFEEGDFDNKFKHISNITASKDHPSFAERYKETKLSFDELQDFLFTSKQVDNPKYVEEVLEPKLMYVMKLAFKSVQFKLAQLQSCFAFVGTDFILDKSMKPWLIEFSKTPSSHDSFKEPGRLMPGLVSELTEILLEIQDKKKRGERDFDMLNSVKNWKRII